MGIAFGPDDRLYVASSSRNSISVFSTDGTFLGKWGSLGSGDGELNRPTGVAVDSSSNVYVLDAGNFRVQKFGAAVVVPPGGTPIPAGPFRLVITRLPRAKNSTSGADVANGSTTSSPAGITCTNCYTTYASLSGSVTLNTTLNSGTNSISWGGDCTGNTVVMDSDKYCNFLYTDSSATYLATSGTLYTLRVSKTAGGTGTVTSSPAGINCGTACASTSTQTAFGAGGTLFTLTATASAGSTFVRWTGDCAGTTTVTTTTLSQNKHCVAVFTTP
ncbi:MAG: 6-bladed beta-propeller [Bdellovibrionota bacterium]